MAKNSESTKVVIWDDIVMMLLALVSGYLLVLEYTSTLTDVQLGIFDTIDTCIAVVFLSEFCIKFFFAENRRAFFKSHWWELLASIPFTTPLTQGLRLLRLLRLIRLVRLLRIHEGVKEILVYVKDFFKHTYIVYVLTVWALIVFASSLAFYSFEHSTNPHVLSFFDSFWWAISTVTTVGYGDVYPVTTAGRIVAMLLMMTGVGTTGIFTALIASFIIKESKTVHGN